MANLTGHYVVASIVTEDADGAPVTMTTTEFVGDYSAASLAEYEDAGGIPWAVYDDGTEAQVAWAEVVEPDRSLLEHVVKDENWFFHDADGAHVADVDQQGWEDAVAGGFPDLDDAKPYNNILLNSTGILFRSGLRALLSITRSAVSFFDRWGDATASFGESLARIGYAAGKHVDVTDEGVGVYDGSSRKALFSDHVQLGDEGAGTYVSDGTLVVGGMDGLVVQASGAGRSVTTGGGSVTFYVHPGESVEHIGLSPSMHGSVKADPIDQVAVVVDYDPALLAAPLLMVSEQTFDLMAEGEWMEASQWVAAVEAELGEPVFSTQVTTVATGGTARAYALLDLVADIGIDVEVSWCLVHPSLATGAKAYLAGAAVSTQGHTHEHTEITGGLTQTTTIGGRQVRIENGMIIAIN